MGAKHSGREKKPRLPNSPSQGWEVDEKVQLLWVKKRSRLFSPLSFNILREICTFLNSGSSVFSVLEDEIFCFDITLLTCRRLCALKRPLTSVFHSSSAYLGRNEFFLCGSIDRCNHCSTFYTAREAYLLSADGTVTQQPDMSDCCSSRGVVYDAVNGVVYVFGGHCYVALKEEAKDFKSGEKFTLTTATWGKLPDMKEARMSFTPCIYNSMVYLCGGGPITVEIYHIKSNSFSLLPDFHLIDTDIYGVASVVDAGKLIILSSKLIYWWDLKERRVVRETVCRSYLTTVSCPPVVSRGVVFFVCGGVCTGVNLSTGEKLMCISSGSL